MAERISMTPEELRSTARNFAEKSEQVTEILDNLKSAVDSLSSSWEGAAQSQFFIMYEEMNKTLQQFPQVLDGMNNQLMSIAQTIDETDANLAQQMQ